MKMHKLSLDLNKATPTYSPEIAQTKEPLKSIIAIKQPLLKTQPASKTQIKMQPNIDIKSKQGQLL